MQYNKYFYYDVEGNLTKHIDRNNDHVDKQYNIDKNIVSISRELINNIIKW